VAVGYGFFLQMKLNEALKFIDKKIKLLNKSAAELNDKACEIKANIKFVLEGLREIQNLEIK
jgi:prefoldin subunit 5